MTQENFVPDNHEVPKSEGQYSKFVDGENRYRILSNPLIVWIIWADGKPRRVKYDGNNKPAKPTGENPSVKYGWLMKVWSYNNNCVEVMELDKKTLLNPLLSHAKDTDWGHPKDYDVIFKKEGSGREGTSYSFIAKPKKPLSAEILAASVEVHVDLEQLLIEGGDPFIKQTSSQSQSNQSQSQPQGNKPPF